MTSKIPVVSISCLSDYLTGNLPLASFHEDQKIKATFKELVDAFTEWGFVYLVDHGIPQNVINGAYQSYKDFFMLDKSVKEKFLRYSNVENLGYVPFKMETLDKNRPSDLKEAFNFLPTTVFAQGLTDHLPEFMSNQTELFNSCKDLSLLMLRLLNLFLPTDDKDFLLSKHRYIGNLNDNASISRFLYYPSISNDENVAENQLRCGEHSDYGTFTLLFQDGVGGLQVNRFV